MPSSVDRGQARTQRQKLTNPIIRERLRVRIPPGPLDKHGPVAQLAERLTTACATCTGLFSNHGCLPDCGSLQTLANAVRVIENHPLAKIQAVASGTCEHLSCSLVQPGRDGGM